MNCNAVRDEFKWIMPIYTNHKGIYASKAPDGIKRSNILFSFVFYYINSNDHFKAFF